MISTTGLSFFNNTNPILCRKVRNVCSLYSCEVLHYVLLKSHLENLSISEVLSYICQPYLLTK